MFEGLIALGIWIAVIGFVVGNRIARAVESLNDRVETLAQDVANIKAIAEDRWR